jgi:hypothetical protein
MTYDLYKTLRQISDDHLVAAEYDIKVVNKVLGVSKRIQIPVTDQNFTFGPVARKYHTLENGKHGWHIYFDDDRYDICDDEGL